MSDQRYVVLGLAHVRSDWFTEVARWATSGSLPIEFVKCISIEELRSRSRSGRPFSAALLDGSLPTVDRDLLAQLRRENIPGLVVTDPTSPVDWSPLGAKAVIGLPLTRAALLDSLATHARLIGPVDATDVLATAATVPTAWLARLVAVVSASGAGGSTIAAAVAQHLAGDPRNGTGVVLADFAHRAHQGILHDARDVVPGVQELVDAHRSQRPSPERVRSMCFDVPGRGYRLVLGLRRPGDWISLRARAFDAALDGLRSTARLLVADVDADVEGEAATGSFDVEDRNLMARATLQKADVVAVVALPTLTGIHGLVASMEDLRQFGVPGDRILAVVNRAPRTARARADLTRSIAVLTGAAERSDPHVGPVFVGERRGIEGIHRDLARFPRPLAAPVAGAVSTLLERLPAREVDAEPEPVAVGSLGSWIDGEDEQGAS